jgi:hypothetical protein
VREDVAVLKLLRRGAIAGLIGGVAYAAWRFLAARAPDTNGVTFEPAPFPGIPRPIPRPAEPPAAHEPERSGDTASSRPADERSGALAERPSARPEGPGAGQQEPWVEPDDGSCPLSHPVKAKLTSGIYHLPGGGNYDRIRAERCYVDADAAIADGLRAPKR